VHLYEPGRIRRTAAKGGDKHTVFRIGEVHGAITKRVQELVGLFSVIDSTKPTRNLWGERWTKLTQNSMRNGVSAATGMTGSQCDNDRDIRRFAIQLGGESVKVGQALGYELEKIGKLQPDRLVQASDGNADALAEIEELMIENTKGNPRAGIQRPSMAQDMEKGRRTEIQFMNGFIADKGKLVGIPTPAHVRLTEVVTRVERGEIPQSPQNLP
jgi:2-dehydropantoate 2-reductase